MLMKKSLIVLVCMVFLLQGVLAQSYNLDINIIPEEKVFFEPGEVMRMIIKDSENKRLDGEVLLSIYDVTGNLVQEEKVNSNGIVEIILNEGLISGEGKLVASYEGSETKEYFSISENEMVKFELEGDTLKVTNIGNTKYEKKISIIIGETRGTKSPSLDIGESKSYRLVAPEGVYNIRISDDGNSEPLDIQNIKLRSIGTGNVIGAIDESAGSRSGITGGISPEEDTAILSYIKGNKFVYVFMLAIFGGMILLAIERKMRKGK